ncbi:MAG: competence/damage-inducible protein A [Pseudonocardiaceae bacterium]
MSEVAVQSGWRDSVPSATTGVFVAPRSKLMTESGVGADLRPHEVSAEQIDVTLLLKRQTGCFLPRARSSCLVPKPATFAHDGVLRSSTPLSVGALASSGAVSAACLNLIVASHLESMPAALACRLVGNGSAEVRAGIVVTGTELLSGLISDRNGPWLAQRLGELGVEVSHLLCVGDRAEDLAATLRFLGDQGVDLIVTSGGLGPTADDLTAEVVAGFAGVELELDEAMEQQIAAILARFRQLAQFSPEALRRANRKQAMVPRGAEPLPPVGTAPGLVVGVPGGPTVIVLPGPPRELQTMWPAALATPAVRAVLSRTQPFETSRLRLFGLPESEIAATLHEVSATLDLAPLEITTCLRRAELEIDIRHRPGAEAARDALIDQIRSRHARYLFSTDGTSLDDQLAGLLQGRWIGLAESCTGGLLAARLTERPGSSDYVAGGVVAYSNAAKTHLLSVPAELIEQHGAVSPEVARAMADGVRQRFGADVGAAITGVAGPGGGTDDKPVGYVCLCVTTGDGAVLARDPVLPGDRAEIRDRSATVAMHLVRRVLIRLDPLGSAP